MAARVQSATGLEPILAPTSIAIIGASQREGSVGNLLTKAVKAGGFTGPIYLVHPTASLIEELPVWPKVSELPSPPHLAIVAVPSQSVLATVAESIEAGAKGFLVISAGFAESGPDGQELEAQLSELVRAHGVRMVGPNCVGILNNHAAFDSVFAQHQSRPGGTAIISQSGAVGVGLLNLAMERNLGVASFVSLGNKPDVSSNDLLLAWGADPQIKQVAVYLESFGNPRNFVTIAQEFTRTKPLLMVKAGRSPAGSKAAASHTGALADSDRTVSALLKQCGVLRFNTVQAMFDAALAFDFGRLPAGPRVGIVTNSGGPAIMAVDFLTPNGLQTANLTQETIAQLQELLPAAAATANPVDTLAGASAADFATAAKLVANDAEVDALILIHTSVKPDDEEVTTAVEEVAMATKKPVLAVRYGRSPTQSKGRTPTYCFPEDAISALSALNKWVEIKNRPVRKTPPATPTPLPNKEGWLSQADALGVLKSAGLPVVQHAACSSLASALEHAKKIGYPVVLKGESDHVHKSEHGLIHLNLAGPNELEKAWRTLEEISVRRAIVMAHAKSGLELLIGGVQDARYGPLVAFGLGGTFAEALGDVHFRLAPLDAIDAEELLDELGARALLGPWRGQPARDQAALRECIQQVSQLMAANPEIAELDINPLILYAEGGCIVDARIRLASV